MNSVPATSGPAIAAPSAHANLFETSHLKEDLGRRTAKSAAITVSAQAVLFVLNLGTTMVLARLLLPEDFGLVAMVQVVIGFIQVFRDGGLSMATVQKSEITHAQISVLFWLNLALSAVIAAVTIALAPLIAWIYGDSRLSGITCVTAASFLISGAIVQHRALMTRQMQFGRLASINILSKLIGSIVAVILAWHVQSYWALVIMPIASSIVEMVLTFGSCRWIPGTPKRGAGVRGMVRYGSDYMAAQAMNYLSRSADNFLIGMTSGAGALGVYTKAYSLLLLPLRQFLGPITSVTVPALSRLVDQPDEFRRFFMRQGSLVVTAAGMSVFFCVASATELITIVLGEKWIDAVPIFWCLAPGAFLSTTNICGTWVCGTHGLANRQRTVAFVAAPTYLIAFAIGSLWGGVGVAAGYSIACLLMRHPNFAYCLRGMPVQPSDIWHMTLRPMIAGGGMLLISIAVTYANPMPIAMAFAFKCVLFAATIALMVGIGWLPSPMALKSSLRPASA
ncbi:MAG: lipopolysaccharide biosynthesis protein [Planctomycetota bacterium]